MTGPEWLFTWGTGLATGAAVVAVWAAHIVHTVYGDTLRGVWRAWANGEERPR